MDRVSVNVRDENNTNPKPNPDRNPKVRYEHLFLAGLRSELRLELGHQRGDLFPRTHPCKPQLSGMQSNDCATDLVESERVVK